MRAVASIAACGGSTEEIHSPFDSWNGFDVVKGRPATSVFQRLPRAAGLLAWLVVSAARTAGASTPLDSASLSPDVTVELGATAQVAADENVAVDNLAGMVALAPLGSLPAAADVSGYELLWNGDRLLCFETTVELPGPVVAEPGDVVRYDGSVYSIEMDASENGVPAGVLCDAVAVAGGTGLLLSFDVTAALPGGLVADDEDLVLFHGASTWSPFFDGEFLGVPAALDVDGAYLFPSGNLALSFDGSGQVGGVGFDDEDVLEVADGGMTWSLAYEDPDWAAADADAIALPEPELPLLLGVGIAGLLALSRSRIR
jgi:hypothetical protein